jgi:membrane fusion protein, multidrug efflux system
MRFGRLAGVAVLALAGAAAYGIYAPDATDRWAPPVSGVAHALHARFFATQGNTATASSSGSPGSAAGQTQPGVAPISVSVAKVERTDFPVVLESLGQVQAYNTVLVRARVDGQIDKIAFKEGQMVKAGDLLAQIDPRPFQAALDQAVAKKAQDEANLANAKLDLARYATLAKQSFATQQQVDTQNSLVNQLTASIAADTAAIDAARVNLDYTTIRAPLSGRVGFRLIDQGNLVNAGQQTGIVTIAQLRPIAVIFTEPQEYVDRINQELAKGPLAVTVENSDGEKLATGKLTVSDNQVDLATATIRLKAEFENTDNRLWPGLAVTTKLTVGVEKNVLIAPEEAVQHGQNGLYVYVVDAQNRAEVRPVKVARQNVTTAVISEGLKEGERVVTAGQLLLQPGAQVAIDAGRGS